MSTRISLIDLSLTCKGSLAERCDVLLQRMGEWESEGNKRTRSLKAVDQLNRLVSMRVRLRAVECPKEIIDQIGGWSSSDVGESYGEGFPLINLSDWVYRISSC